MKESLKRFLKNPYSYLFLILTAMLVFACTVVKLEMLSDDGCYLQMMADHPRFSDYLSYTYQCLNGRLVANTLMFVMLKLNAMWLWCIITVAALISIGVNVSRMFGKSANLKGTALTLGLICCLGFRVLSSSVLWFTGAIFYIWPIALAVYLLVRLSKRFYADEPMRLDWRFFCELLLGGLLMLWSEQDALVLLGFYLVYFLYRWLIRKKGFDYLTLSVFALWAALFCVMFFAPSQAERMNNVYGYAALGGGVGYLVQNGLYWTYGAIFVQQRTLMLIFGAVALICTDRKKHPVLAYSFEALLAIALSTILIHGTAFEGYVNASPYIYGIAYFPEAGYSIGTLLPYVFWTLYSVLLVSTVLVSSKNKLLTVLVMLASLATLLIMWFSTTMYASGYRTCALFCVGMIALMVKLLDENQKSCTALIVGAGTINILLFAGILTAQFGIYY